ncbi:MAG: glycoside hydrolase [Treponema sp.]|nr:glycoside hydrolase [Treponema sp.]
MIYKKNFIAVLFILSGFLLAGETANKIKPFTEKPVTFDETWGYVSIARSNEYNDSIPLTDVCFFSADVNCYGELISVPNRNAIEVNNKRTHMVFICESKSLTHFILSPEFSIRQNIIDSLIEAAQDFDGLQLDLELVPEKDAENYLSFISELKNKLEGKMLSICVPARFKLLQNDVYPYAKLASLCDRIFVMAYDEHWAGGSPGPVASVEWCEKVCTYAKKTIPKEKLIMGIPFYGRTWTDKTTSGAWYYSGANRIMNENDCTDFYYDHNIPSFSFTTEVKVTGYMNDTHSVLTLCNLYKSKGIHKTGFWRIGQEDPEVWNYIKIKN